MHDEHDHEHDHDHDHDHEHEHETTSRSSSSRRGGCYALGRIRQYGDSALRMRAREVETVDDDVRASRSG